MHTRSSTSPKLEEESEIRSSTRNLSANNDEARAKSKEKEEFTIIKIFEEYERKNEDWRTFFKAFIKKEPKLSFLESSASFRVVFSNYSSSTGKAAKEFMENEKFAILFAEYFCRSSMEKVRVLKNCLQLYKYNELSFMKRKISDLKKRVAEEIRVSSGHSLGEEFFSSDSEEEDVFDLTVFSYNNRTNKKRNFDTSPKATKRLKRSPEKEKEKRRVTFTVSYSPPPSRRSERIARRSKTPYTIKEKDSPSEERPSQKSQKELREEFPKKKRSSERIKGKTLTFTLTSPRGRTTTSFRAKPPPRNSLN